MNAACKNASRIGSAVAAPASPGLCCARLGRWSKFDALDGFIKASAHLRGFAFVEAALEFLQARYTADPVEIRRIPPSGPLLIVANHPSGALDALALLDLVGRVRGDVRIVANDLLSALDGLDGLILPIRILGGRPGPDSLRAIEAALQAGQCVIVFPAGEVARLGLRGITDGRWRRGFLRFARASGAPVLPVRIEARNSALFYGASVLFKPVGTALLAREMLARRSRRIALRIGRPLTLPPDGDPEQLLRAVRRELHAIGTRRERPAAAARVAEGAEPLVDAVDPAAVRAGIEDLALLGRTVDGKQIRAGRLQAGAPLLRELGRLRELTFRAVGEGTGQRLDVDMFDSWYEHIVLWDAEASKIAGAYRLARGAQVLAERGLAGLYTASLFRYADDAVPRLAAGMELGRSFVAPDYWGGRSIDYLWQGIGAYLARHPNVRYLYGPVSISAALPPAGARADRCLLPALPWQCRCQRAVAAAVRLSRRAAAVRCARRRHRVPRAEAQPGRARCHAADALQAIHRAVRAGRGALPRVWRRPGVQRRGRRPDRSRPAAGTRTQARALPGAARAMPVEAAAAGAAA